MSKKVQQSNKSYHYLFPLQTTLLSSLTKNTITNSNRLECNQEKRKDEDNDLTTSF